MSTPALVSGSRMQKTGDWLFEPEVTMKVIVDKQDSHDSRFFRDLDTERRTPANDDEREWTDAELLMDPIDWYEKRLLAEVKLGDK